MRLACADSCAATWRSQPPRTASTPGAHIKRVWAAGESQMGRGVARRATCVPYHSATRAQSRVLTTRKIGSPDRPEHQGATRNRTAREYSNAISRERLRHAATDQTTCPNDRQRPRCQEFASRGQRFKSLQLHPPRSRRPSGQLTRAAGLPAHKRGPYVAQAQDCCRVCPAHDVD